jgi:hypothetical protein
MIVVAIGVAACGAPTVQQAVERNPGSGTTESFGRPYPEVYAAVKSVIAQTATTPEWKELRLVHDDPEHGIVIAERRLEGVIPGVRVRDLWSFYLTRAEPELTRVTFVLDSSDRLAAAGAARSWAKAKSDVFPAISEALGPPPPRRAADTHTPPDARAPLAGQARRDEAPPAAARTTAPRDEVAPPAVALSAPPRAGAPVYGGEARHGIADVYAALQASDDWRRSARRRTLAGDDVVTVGDWAQLDVRGDRVEVVFPSYPAPPAYDVARLVGFLGQAGFRVEVLPGTAFRAP